MKNLRLIPNIHPPQAMVKANFAFDPAISVHLLRHRFDTHLQKQGIDLEHIQILLGHNSIKTTEGYTQASIQEIGIIKNHKGEYIR
ncbi:MAG: tyrosine-type recombinase/integrase [Flavobacteriaceae bacterium]|nr:tyrosine-type recombinase/integrase [Flavobacteriaceae bacterium]